MAALRVGLALGGGAARGLAHLGVLRALRAAQVPIDVVGGTSIGALVGGLYATTPSIAESEDRLRSFLRSPEFARMRIRFLKEDPRPSGTLVYSVSSLLRKGILLGYSMTRESFVPAEEFARHIRALLPDVRIEDAAVPLVIVAADLNTGHQVDLVEGRLRDAVSGSCAIPGLLPPMPLNGHLLIDGGWIAKVPVRPVRALGADFVIAVDVAQDLEDTRSFRTGLNIVTRANAICSNRLREMQVAEADFVIRPAVQGIHWADFSRLDEAIALGEAAVEACLEELQARVARLRRLSRLRFWKSAR